MVFNEQNRRDLIRISAFMLIILMGPSDAWGVGGLEGLLGYIAIHIASKNLISHISSRDKRYAFTLYRAAPLLLVVAGVISHLSDDWYALVVFVPILLGAYEGGFWTLYHSIREAQKVSTNTFQSHEVVTGVIGASLVFIFDYSVELISPGAVGGLLALASYAIRIDEGSLTRLDDFLKGASDTGSSQAVRGRLASQPYAIIQFTARESMRLVALATGGLARLTIFVALGVVLGNWVRRFLESEDRPPSDSWIIGSKVTLAAMIAMIVFLRFGNIEGFAASYVFAYASIMGIMRKAEMDIADPLLDGTEFSIGMRERMKFRAHLAFVLAFGLVYAADTALWGALGYENIATIGLGAGAVCALFISQFGEMGGYSEATSG